MPRKVFSNYEKRCLQRLIIKYKLNTSSGNPSIRKTAWARLTSEYNSIETNTRRTEAQLKKCYDNMKTRSKMELTEQKKEPMHTGKRPYRPSPETSSSTAHDSMLVDGDALSELTTDRVTPNAATKKESVPPEEPQLVLLVTHDQGEEHCEVKSEGQRRSMSRTGSRLSDYEDVSSLASDPTDNRVQRIQSEFSLREENYKRARERDDELHKLKVAERKWLVKAAEEMYKKACLEREAAQITLDALKK